MLYDKIKELCNQHGISIYKLEKDCNFSQNSILKWQKSSPKIDNLSKVATYFEVPVDYLLGTGLFAKQELIEQHIDEIIAPFKEISLEEFPEPFKSVMKGFVSIIDSQPIYKQIEFLQIFFKDIDYDEKTKSFTYIPTKS